MRIVLVFIGILIVFAGIMPFLSGVGILPESIPTSGAAYSGVIVAIGAIGLIYALMNVTIMGFEKIVITCLTLMTILGGVLPFIGSFVPAFIPTTGIGYSAIIIVVGLVGIVYGMISIG